MRVPRDLENFWFLIDASRRVPDDRPIGVTVLGKRLVVFRDHRGEPQALEDRCLHRHVSLSSGRMEDGCVVCPYHGLAFDGSGACVAAPPLVAAGDRPNKRIATFAARESDGCIWVNLATRPAAFENPWPTLDGEYKTFDLSYTIPSSVESILENFVDTSHTGELHRGYFRGKATRVVDVVVKRSGNEVSVETLGEGSSDAALSRLLNPRGLPVEHVDRYLPPYAVRVDYRFGDWHVVTMSVCRPIAPFETFVMTRVSLRAGRVTPVLVPLLKGYTQRILAQDIRILTDHGEQVRRFGGPKDVALKTDVGVVCVLRAYEAHLAGEPGPPDEVVYRFPMRL